ncbi:hypothetical protein [Herbaspirillum sp. alder98]|nr:hypothetical protein [Herbaspirillum sp. alder98]
MSRIVGGRSLGAETPGCAGMYIEEKLKAEIVAEALEKTGEAISS